MEINNLKFLKRTTQLKQDKFDNLTKARWNLNGDKFLYVNYKD